MPMPTPIPALDLGAASALSSTCEVAVGEETFVVIVLEKVALEEVMLGRVVLEKVVLEEVLPELLPGCVLSETGNSRDAVLDPLSEFDVAVVDTSISEDIEIGAIVDACEDGMTTIEGPEEVVETGRADPETATDVAALLSETPVEVGAAA